MKIFKLKKILSKNMILLYIIQLKNPFLKETKK